MTGPRSTGPRSTGPRSTGPHRVAQGLATDCDVLVIGSGAGGATVAERLTAEGLDVLMLEEGAYLDVDNRPSSVPHSVAKLWRDGGLTVSLGSPKVAYIEGRCVGGGTESNSAIMQRAPEALLDQWAERYGIAEFGAEALAGYYDRVARAVNASVTRGKLGEPSDLLRKAGKKLGWQVKALERAQEKCVGTNLCAAGCPTGGKRSMTTTAIPAALGRGLRLIAECRADRLVLEGGRVTAVRATARDQAGRRHRVLIRPKQVFLCAGPVHTPALLLRSKLRHQVGATLRMHPTIKVTARFGHAVEAASARLPLYAISEFMPDQRIGGSFFRPGFFGMSLAEDWKERGWLLPDWERCGMYYAMARAEAAGRIKLLPGLGEPVVRYNLTPADWRNLASGLGRLGQAMFAAGATHVYPSIAGHPGWTEAGQCGEFETRDLPAERTNLMTIHLFSSCPPGEDRSRCATDSFGAVRDVENLVLADGSQIPEAPGVNPQLTIMALALRAAEAFLERQGGGRLAA